MRSYLVEATSTGRCDDDLIFEIERILDSEQYSAQEQPYKHTHVRTRGLMSYAHIYLAEQPSDRTRKPVGSMPCQSKRLDHRPLHRFYKTVPHNAIMAIEMDYLSTARKAQPTQPT